MLYAVYFAYHKNDILDSDSPGYDEIPDYPADLARVRIYNDPYSRTEAYANTMCPASQTIDAENTEDLEQKVTQMELNFLNEDWLEENIRPFI